MAVVASGCYHQTRFKEAFAMNALGVILHDIMLRYIVGPGHYFALPVACSTEDGDIHFIGTGFRICVMQDVVVAMTLLATGGMGIIH